MGIVGLLPLLKSVTRDVHIRDYKGMKVAIDAHGWLHRAVYSCGTFDIPTYTRYCTQLIESLLKYDIRPIVVFDGKSLPAKSITSDKRRLVREQYAEKAKEAERMGFYADAEKFFKKTILVSDDIVSAFIDVLREMSIDYVVSPYEADAQLTHLSLYGIADVIITEDSDALVYGCQRVLFKLDAQGHGKEIQRSDLGSNVQLSFENWTDEQFKLFCCLSGCDYVPKLPYVGIKTAHRIAAAHATFGAVVDYLKRMRRDCDSNYFMQLARGLLTFSHQTVLDPATGVIQHLLPLRTADMQEEGTALHFLRQMELQRTDQCGQTDRGVDVEFLGPIFQLNHSEDSESLTEVPHTESQYNLDSSISLDHAGRTTPDHTFANKLSESPIAPSPCIQPSNSPAGHNQTDYISSAELDVDALFQDVLFTVSENDKASDIRDTSQPSMSQHRKRCKKGDRVTLRQVLNEVDVNMFSARKDKHADDDDTSGCSIRSYNNDIDGGENSGVEGRRTDPGAEPTVVHSQRTLKRARSVHQHRSLYPVKYIRNELEDKSPGRVIETLHRRQRRLQQENIGFELSPVKVRAAPSSCLLSALQFLNVPMRRQDPSSGKGSTTSFQIKYTHGCDCVEDSGDEDVRSIQTCIPGTGVQLRSPLFSQDPAADIDDNIPYNLPWLEDADTNTSIRKASTFSRMGKPGDRRSRTHKSRQSSSLVSKFCSSGIAKKSKTSNPTLFKTVLQNSGAEKSSKDERYWDQKLN